MFVFVYGTLKRGYRNHHLLEGSKFQCEAVVKGFELYDLGPYPAVIESGDLEDLVKGEIFEIDGSALARLDELEEEGTLYKRIKTKAFTGSYETEVFVYVYLLGLDQAKKLEIEWP